MTKYRRRAKSHDSSGESGYIMFLAFMIGWGISDILPPTYFLWAFPIMVISAGLMSFNKINLLIGFVTVNLMLLGPLFWSLI